MASIKKVGNSYRFSAYKGINEKGTRLYYYKTWTPPENMTSRKAEKEARHQAELFEEECRKRANTMGGNTKLKDFVAQWFEDYASQTLKPTTISSYRFFFKKILAELGNMRLDKIQPQHLLRFYKKLAEEPCADSDRVVATARLSRIMKQRNLSARELSQSAGVYINAVSVALRGDAIDRSTADKIAATLGVMLSQIFVPKGCSRLAPSTIRHYHTAISSVLSTAVEWQLIERNPAKIIKPPRVVREEAKYLDDKQAIHLLELLDQDEVLPVYRCAVMVLLFTGMRRGELLGLHWDDINFEDSTISIHRSLCYVSGKGLFEDTTKNKSSARVIKVPTHAIAALRRWKAEQAQQRMAVGDQWVESDYVFTRPFGLPIRPDTLTGWFGNWIKTTDLPPIHLHTLRHTNATLLVASGTNIQTVAKRMGHSSSNTTANIYAHAIQSADAAASETLNDILCPIPKKGKRRA